MRKSDSSRPNNALTVPEGAIEFSGDSTFYLYVLTDSVPTQKFTRRQVQTGINDGVISRLKSGLKANESGRGLKKNVNHENQYKTTDHY